MFRMSSPALALAVILAAATGVRAQEYEVVGTRALGMAGAFVGVADDATAVYWNPAGPAMGAIFSLVAETGPLEIGGDDDDRRAGAPGGRRAAVLIALATLPVGLTYYRLEAVDASPGQPGESRDLSSRTTDHVGVTLLHSFTPAVAVGGTAKYVRGGVGEARSPTAGDPLDAAERLDRTGSGAFDADLGVMAALGRARLGLAVRNLLEPAFEGDGEARFELERQVRAGVSWGPSERLVVAIDADLTRTPGVTGDRRNVAAGGETWWGRRRVGLRAGVRASTVGDARPVGAFGLSVGLLRTFWLDAHLARGTAEADRSWSVAARLGM